jgi:hypothetical protein
MLTFLFLLLASYAVGIVLPLCFPRMPQMQGMVGSGYVASIFGIALGIGGLIASEALTASVSSTIPFLAFAVRFDPLAGLATSIYAI